MGKETKYRDETLQSYLFGRMRRPGEEHGGSDMPPGANGCNAQAVQMLRPAPLPRRFCGTSSAAAVAAKLRRMMLLAVALGVVCTLAAQTAPQLDAGSGTRPYRPARRQPVGIVYWDLDHLHDTIPALFYNDDDYTPGGRLRWNSARYVRKIRNTAAIIDSMGLPLVALWSIENEAVVRDLAAACAGEYSYLHRTLNSLDGMDFALLYYGDVFFPRSVEAGRRYLYIEGVLRHPGAGQSERLGLVLCSDVRTALWLIGDLREEHPGVPLLVLGRTALPDPEAYGLRDVTARATSAGHGNVRRRGGWSMRDRIVADTALDTRGGDAFIRRALLDDRGEPLPTYDRRRYRGGYGYALPVFVYLE